MSDYSEKSMKNFALIINAKVRFREFIKIVKSKNNKAIESTDMVITLKKLLDSENKVNKKILGADDRLYYRSRKVDFTERDEKFTSMLKYENDEAIIQGFDKYDSKEPPLGVGGNNRNSILGASYLYLSDNIHTSCAEIKTNLNDIISVASFRIKKPLKIIDFSENYNFKEIITEDDKYSVAELITRLMYRYSTSFNDENEYYATQFVADLIRKYGYDGISYVSSKSKGVNYTIFNCCEENIEFVKSELMICRCIEYSLVELNSCEIAKPNSSIDMYNFSEKEQKSFLDLKNSIVSTLENINGTLKS